MKRFFLFLLFFFNSSAFSIADWTLYVHMAADNNLSAYASIDLVDEMAKATLSEKINVVAQCDLPNHEGAYRFKIENGQANVIETLTSEMGQNPAQDLVSGMNWAKNNFPAKHYAISLWGHGSGIIDPIRNLTRGILYDDTNGTYLNNQDMLSSLMKIKNEVLGGNKIDVLGMDACLMADIEVGYQIKDCVNYFVASQQSEPALGWDYRGFLTAASQNYLTPDLFATAIVESYKDFYDNKKTIDYTQSAVDLTKIDLIEHNLSLIVDTWNKCEEIFGVEFKNVINAVRQKSLELDDDDFIDLHFFCKIVLEEIEKVVLPKQKPDPKPEPGVSSVSEQILVSEQEETEVIHQQPRPSLIFQRPSFASNFFNRPNFGSRPGVFIRPNNFLHSNLISRPSSTPRPPRPYVNVLPRPQIIVSPSGWPRPVVSLRPNLRPSYIRPNYNRPPRPIILPRSLDELDSLRYLNFMQMDLTNQELEVLSTDLQKLKDLFNEEMLLIEQSVIANATGPDMIDAKGISIYFPKSEIHSSYYLTNFANDGKWVSFLEKFIS